MGIVVENIEKSYKDTQAVCDVSFDVKDGELFGLIGPDGAGKTTLFRILATLLLPGKGQAWIKGLHVVDQYKDVRNLLGYMPGRFSLYTDLSVEENLMFFASIFNVRFDRNFALIRDIYAQLAPFKNRLAGKLSGGMKQKLALCCALIHKPEVLLLDEPTTGVDSVSRNEFWEMLAELKKEGITILVSTPYMDEANRCDRVALIQNGRIMQIDAPGDIVKAFTREIYAVRSHNLYRTLMALKEGTDTYAVYPFGQSLHYIPATSNPDLPSLRSQLERSGIERIEINAIHPNIEDCFIELMRHEPNR